MKTIDEFTEKLVETEVDALQLLLQNRTGRSAYVLAMVVDEDADLGAMKAQGGHVSKRTGLVFAEQLERKAAELRRLCSK